MESKKFLLILGDGKESRHEYTEFVCATSPQLYQLSHYLFDEYDMDGDHHLVKADYDNLFDTMDTDSKCKLQYWLEISSVTCYPILKTMFDFE